MDEIFKQYGSTIITVLAIIAVIGIITLVIGNDNTSVVYQAFVCLFVLFCFLIKRFYKDANMAAGFAPAP